MSAKLRLDQLLVERGLAKSRSAAQRFILAGEVEVEGQVVDKPASQISPSAKIKLKSGPKYVSQGGVKLERALEIFSVDVNGKICVDIGASTGGFTDCLLKHGAAKVYAIDVGKGQLDWRLRNDTRIVVMESINARYLQPEQIPDQIELVTADVSFISLKLVLPPVLKLLAVPAELILLVKPQFEAGPEHVERGGVVKSADVHIAVLTEIARFTEDELNLSVLNATYSPFKGPAGNIEFLMHLSSGTKDEREINWSELVEASYLALGKPE